MSGLHLFLSPHLDDAALSCGATICALNADSPSTIILNIMAGDPHGTLPDTPIVHDLHTRWDAGEHPTEARLQEDRAAAGILGSSTMYLQIPDCVYRMTTNNHPAYPSEESLFGDVHPLDTAATILRKTGLPNDEITHLYIPLAVGNHVDHQIVLGWGLELSSANPELTTLFYEDYPYCEDQQAVNEALQNLYVKTEAQHFPVDELYFQAKIQALMEYKSQISTFWTDSKQMERRLWEYMAYVGNGELVERYWRLIK